MGNTNSNKRDRAYSSDAEGAPTQGKVFEFNVGSKKEKLLFQPSLDESDDALGKSDDLAPRVDTDTSQILYPTVFKWGGGGKDVFIGGTFSDWKPVPMVPSHGNFALILEVPEGEHEFKFQVDGQWIHDPSQPTIDNDIGSKNNSILVKKSDFLVFEALEADSICSSTSGSPMGSYAQEVPQHKACEKSVGPPILPPHLLQVILNKDPLSYEPTLLPEPNHVMLNHLYALSIKEGVMVLSATHRYKKKYVTTLLYKPI